MPCLISNSHNHYFQIIYIFFIAHFKVVLLRPEYGRLNCKIEKNSRSFEICDYSLKWLLREDEWNGSSNIFNV